MRHALPWLSISFGLGILAGAGTALPGTVVTRALVGACVLGLAALAARGRRWVLLLPVAAFLAGHARVSVVIAPRRAPCHVAHHVSREPMQLHAEVADLPVPTHDGTRQRLRALAGVRAGASLPLCGHVELHQGPGAVTLWPGERVVLGARLRPAVGPRNPDLPSPQLRRLSEDVGAVVVARPDETLLAHAVGPSWLRRLRARVATRVNAALPTPSAGRAIVSALVLGAREELSGEQVDRFARAGVVHLLSVSGLHLTFVAGSLFALLLWSLRRLPWLAGRLDVRPVAALGAAAAAILYTALTGAESPTVRACVMSCALFCGVLAGRPGDGWRGLAAAALLLLLLDPVNLFRPSFQLTFAAMTAVALSSPRGDPRPVGLVRRSWRATRALLVGTAAATLLTAPIVAHHFGSTSVVGLLANLLAVPWTTAVVMPLALGGAFLSTTGLPIVATPVLEAAAWSAEQLDRMAHHAAALPGSAIACRPGWPVALGLLAVGLAVLTRRRLRVLMGALGGLLLAAAFAASLAGRSGRTLEATVLDVGQGDSIYLRLPGGEAVLVDGGGVPGSAYDVGARRVVPFLRAQKVQRVSLLVATHPHADHVAGLLAVLDGVPVDELWTCWHDEPSALHEALLERARRRGVPVRRPRLWRRGEVTVRPLWPGGAEGHCADPFASTNDNSIVLRVEHGRASLILAGDVEADSEGALVRRYGDALRATVLKVSHHGSRTSSTDSWLAAISPQLAVVSCGFDNAFGFPHPEVLERYRAARIPLLRTDRLGAVRLRLEASGAASWTAPFSLIP
ncbi:MAG: DNA internalization-related competence protein ComEC/Rec2 [Deltaproteobacteria bacterium]|nr:DNA internalization-related competence protein ComEC/Rec2 [Deltaproteobacteria bacterium]